MSYGYSLRLAELNEQADEQSLGVRLGRVCIAKNIPVADVAERLGVSRQTIYNWFSGATEPQGDSVSLVGEYLAEIR